MKVDGKTNVYGIIGDPVAHSLSPVFQNYFAHSEGVEAAYMPFHVYHEDLHEAIQGLRALHVRGVNITIPHKESVMNMVVADHDASMIGAVNTLAFCDDEIRATNTDWLGVRDVLTGMQIALKGCTVLVFGAGGTSKAILHALGCLGVAEVFVCNRNQARLQQLLHHARTVYPDLTMHALEWTQQAAERASENSVLMINATSVGLDGSPFPFALKGKGYAFDAVYRKNGCTGFCEMAQKHGRLVSDGLPMLVAQGAASFAWWHGMKSPDKLAALRWLEEMLGRERAYLPGWEAV